MPLSSQQGMVRAMGLVLLLGTLAACDEVTGLDGRSREERDLSRARRNWSLSYIDDYDYVLRHNCFCQLGGVPVRVSVRNGVVVDLVLQSSGQPLSLSWADQYPSVTGLFALLQEAIDRDADLVDAIYDAQYGLPIDIWVDYDWRLADEERGYEVSSFRPLR
jgi:hypothetical protein